MFTSRKWNPIQTPHLRSNLMSHLSNLRTSNQYHGVFLSLDMSWSIHINFICSKTMKHIIEDSTDVNSHHALLEMYKLLVRLHLECAALVWNPHLIRNISKLENARMFALRHKIWDAGYQMLWCYVGQSSFTDTMESFHGEPHL